MEADNKVYQITGQLHSLCSWPVLSLSTTQKGKV